MGITSIRLQHVIGLRGGFQGKGEETAETRQPSDGLKDCNQVSGIDEYVGCQHEVARLGRSDSVPDADVVQSPSARRSRRGRNGWRWNNGERLVTGSSVALMVHELETAREVMHSVWDQAQILVSPWPTCIGRDPRVQPHIHERRRCAAEAKLVSIMSGSVRGGQSVSSGPESHASLAKYRILRTLR